MTRGKTSPVAMAMSWIVPISRRRRRAPACPACGSGRSYVLPPAGGGAPTTVGLGATGVSGHPRRPPHDSAGSPGPRDCEVSLRSSSHGDRSDNEKDPSSACRTRGRSRRGTHARPRMTGRRPRRRAPSLVLWFGTVRRRARTRCHARGRRPAAVPATLAFALSRRGLFYPLASLDISGQWPVFEQEPLWRYGSSRCACSRAPRSCCPRVDA